MSDYSDHLWIDHSFFRGSARERSRRGSLVDHPAMVQFDLAVIERDLRFRCFRAYETVDAVLPMPDLGEVLACTDGGSQYALYAIDGDILSIRAVPSVLIVQAAVVTMQRARDLERVGREAMKAIEDGGGG